MIEIKKLPKGDEVSFLVFCLIYKKREFLIVLLEGSRTSKVTSIFLQENLTTYICEQGAVVGVEGNRLQVKYKDGMCLLPIMSMWKDKDYMSPEFCLGLSKRLVSGKISNQMVMVRSYKRYKEMSLEEEDSVRIYRMTGYGEVILFGQNQKLENEEVVIL